MCLSRWPKCDSGGCLHWRAEDMWSCGSVLPQALFSCCAGAVDLGRSCPLPFVFLVLALISAGPQFTTYYTRNPIFPASHSWPFVGKLRLFFGPQSLPGCHWTLPPTKYYYFQGAPFAQQCATAATATFCLFLFCLFSEGKGKKQQVLSLCERRLSEEKMGSCHCGLGSSFQVLSLGLMLAEGFTKKPCFLSDRQQQAMKNKPKTVFALRFQPKSQRSKSERSTWSESSSHACKRHMEDRFPFVTALCACAPPTQWLSGMTGNPQPKPGPLYSALAIQRSLQAFQFLQCEANRIRSTRLSTALKWVFQSGSTHVF